MTSDGQMTAQTEKIPPSFLIISSKELSASIMIATEPEKRAKPSFLEPSYAFQKETLHDH
ncbi:hypothetical protein MED193_06269 [Roseobacter sp. MED193]|nr:hypothetical protein MED193_06269 [Roseobacter sp. MED193]